MITESLPLGQLSCAAVDGRPQAGRAPARSSKCVHCLGRDAWKLVPLPLMLGVGSDTLRHSALLIHPHCWLLDHCGGHESGWPADCRAACGKCRRGVLWYVVRAARWTLSGACCHVCHARSNCTDWAFDGTKCHPAQGSGTLVGRRLRRNNPEQAASSECLSWASPAVFRIMPIHLAKLKQMIAEKVSASSHSHVSWFMS